MGIYLSGLMPRRPRYDMSQEDSFKWLTKAHAQADSLGNEKRPAEFFRAILDRVGCSPMQIARRGFELPDFLSFEWDTMRIYRLRECPQGLGTDERTSFYRERVEEIFEELYAEDTTPPDDIIHVTCSGYVSPSGAQSLVQRRGWEAHTVITHAYQMGCYASIPALRIARGFVTEKSSRVANPFVHIVHTELCGLHVNPADHSYEQFVIQSLFADGMVKYQISGSPSTSGPCYQILGLEEEMIPHTGDAMAWYCSSWGMRMSLSKSVPALVKEAARSFLNRMGERCGIDLSKETRKTFFAIHPGGPKILDELQQQLALSNEQMQFSRKVLRSFGNMSSATLPHIWDEILGCPDVPNGSLVVSLAFGPGLTIAGALMRKLS